MERLQNQEEIRGMMRKTVLVLISVMEWVMVWLKKMSPSSNATESVCESLWLKRAKNKIKKRGR